MRPDLIQSPLLVVISDSMLLTAAFALAIIIVSFLMSHVALLYAKHRSLLDHPDERRSHTTSTPRGGGIAPVLVWFATLALLAVCDVGPEQLRALIIISASSMMVALVSWIDDHRPLPAIPRLLVHLGAATFLVLGLQGAGDGLLEHSQRLLLALALVLATNFWNFMDGIDGLAVIQSIFCSALMGLAALLAGSTLIAMVSFALALSIVGFAPLNFPRARIFLGDVGSTTMGFAIAAVGVWGLRDTSWGWSLWPLLASLFMIDAGATLLQRMLQGQRWYSPHCEHLYQRLHRLGLSHPRVVALYMACNLLLILPFYVALFEFPDAGGWLWLAAWLLVGSGWFIMKRWVQLHAQREMGPE